MFKVNDLQNVSAAALVDSRTVPASIRPVTRAHPAPGVPLGEWVLVPGSARFFGKTSDAYIERSGERVQLRHCSNELQKFVRTMGRIEADFTRRCALTRANRNG